MKIHWKACAPVVVLKHFPRKPSQKFVGQFIKKKNGNAIARFQQIHITTI